VSHGSSVNAKSRYENTSCIFAFQINHSEVYLIRTNIVMKSGVLEIALRELVGRRRQVQLLNLPGKELIDPDYNIRVVRARLGEKGQARWRCFIATVWIEYLHDQTSEKTERLRSLPEEGDVVCTWVIGQEILQGAADQKKLKYCATTLFLWHNRSKHQNPCQRKCLVCPLRWG
jgi:hypothetical protein